MSFPTDYSYQFSFTGNRTPLAEAQTSPRAGLMHNGREVTVGAPEELFPFLKELSPAAPTSPAYSSQPPKEPTPPVQGGVSKARKRLGTRPSRKTRAALPPEEKLALKRERNRLNAKKLRAKRNKELEEGKEAIKEAGKLAVENMELRARIQQLEGEVGQLNAIAAECMALRAETARLEKELDLYRASSLSLSY